MEVSNEIKEDIRKTQSDLKNAIKIHQDWVARLQEDENNKTIQSKVKDAEQDIINIGQTQKRVVDRLRRELELYQQRLKSRNKHVNIENDNKYVAQQLRDHQIQHRNKNRSRSLLKSKVLTEIHIKSVNGTKEDGPPSNDSDSESEVDAKPKISEKSNSRNCAPVSSVNDSRSKFVNALNKVKKSLIASIEKRPSERDARPAVSASPSPSPSPPPLPADGETVSQEMFLRFLGLVTPRQKEILEFKRNKRRKRSTTSTNRNEFIYGSFDMMPKRRKLNEYPYLQSHSGPPQTRSAKLRKQQKQNDRLSREASPSGSSSETVKGGWDNNKPAWAACLPPGLSVEPIYAKKACHGCGRNDVPSLLVWCSSCFVHWHTGCGENGRCTNCRATLPEPSNCASPSPDSAQLFRDKLKERKQLQERNMELCQELRKLEARAATLKENLNDHNSERCQLLTDQIETQRNLQKLLSFIGQFKDTTVSIRSASVSEAGSDACKLNGE